MSKKLMVFAMALLFFRALHSAGDAAKVAFKPAVTYVVSATPTESTGGSLSAAVGDFDGDGKLDLAVVYSADQTTIDDGHINILLSNGDGTFRFGDTLTAGKNPYSIAVGDFNGDGNLDLVVTNLAINIAQGGFLPGSVSVFLGNGNGTFQGHVDYPTDKGPNAVAVGDFNADGHLDFAVKAGFAHVVGVFLGRGDGTFEPRVDNAAVDGRNGRGIGVGDFNRDGKLDLADGEGNVNFFEGNGDGTLQLPIRVGVSFPNSPVAVADLNGDDKLDVVTGVSLGLFGEDVGARAFMGDGNGTFSPPISLATGTCHATSPLIADFDGDNKPDIALVGGGAPASEFGCLFLGNGTIVIFPGNGDGTFKTPLSVPTDYAYNLIAVADFNGDNAPDLITMNNLEGPLANSVGAVLNNTGADFSITPSVSNLGTIGRGQSKTIDLTLAHLNNFNVPVELSCSVQPAIAAPNCSITPTSLRFDNTGQATAALTVSTGAATASLAPPSKISHHPTQLLWLLLGSVLLLASCSRCHGRRLRVISLIAIAVLGGLTLQFGCGGGSNPHHSTAYTITITGSSESTAHSTTVNIAVE